MVCSVKANIIMAAVGISAGLTAGPSFFFMYNNISTTCMALLSSCFAALALYMHLTYKNKAMQQWSATRFRFLIYFNSTVFVFAVIGMLLSMLYAIVNKQGILGEDLEGENLWMTAVWCFMTSKWSSMCAYYARHYFKEIEELRPLVEKRPEMYY